MAASKKNQERRRASLVARGPSPGQGRLALGRASGGAVTRASYTEYVDFACTREGCEGRARTRFVAPALARTVALCDVHTEEVWRSLVVMSDDETKGGKP